MSENNTPEFCSEPALQIQHHRGDVCSKIMELLLTADPSKEAVKRYLGFATLLTAIDSGNIIGVAAFALIGNEAELKNLAVLPAHQGKGIAKQLIKEVASCARLAGAKVLMVGTGNSSLAQLALYQKSGFRVAGVIPNYFASYPEPIYENGISCLDKIQLRLEL